MLVRPGHFWPALNYTRGRDGTAIDHVVLYCTRTTGLKRTIEICTDPKEERSYHFVIGRQGLVVQTVRITDTAWHASGTSLNRANRRSIGIALVGAGNNFTSRQYSSLYRILVLLIKILGVTEDHILGYEHIHSGSIICPGPNFSWKRILDRLFPLSNHDDSPVNFDRKGRNISVLRLKLDENIFGSGKN